MTIAAGRAERAVALDVADYAYVHGERPHRARRHRPTRLLAHQDIREFYLGIRRHRAAQLPRRQAVPPQPALVWLSPRSASSGCRWPSAACACCEGVSFAVHPGELLCPDRAQRRGQDQHPQLHRRHLPAQQRPHRVRGPRGHRHPASRDRPARPGAHVPARRAVRAHDGAGEPPGGAPRARRHQSARRGLPLAPHAPGRGRAPPGRRGDPRRSSSSTRYRHRAGRRPCPSASRR